MEERADRVEGHPELCVQVTARLIACGPSWAAAAPMWALILAGGMAVVACAGGAPAQSPTQPGNITPAALNAQPPWCAIRCIAPPVGCEYRGQVLVGPCEVVRCGQLVCQPPDIIPPQH